VGDVVLIWGDGRQRLEDEQALAIEEISRTPRALSCGVAPVDGATACAGPMLEMAPGDGGLLHVAARLQVCSLIEKAPAWRRAVDSCHPCSTAS